MTRALERPKKKNPLVPARAPKPLPAARSRAALGLAVAASEGEFRLQVCQDCGAVQYPPRDVCGNCLSDALKWRAAERYGTLVATTQTRISSERFFRERPAWRTGLVTLDGGVGVIAHLHADCEVGGRVLLDIKLDPAGRGAMFATPERAAPHQEDDPRIARFHFRSEIPQRADRRTGAPRPRRPSPKRCSAPAPRGVYVGLSEAWRPIGPRPLPKAVEIVALDPTDAKSVEELADRIGDKVDILVNNSDYFRPAGVVDGQDPARARLTFETHCLGFLRLAAAFGPVMRARTAETGRSAAAFVNIISAWCLSGSSEHAAYAGSQAALRSLSLGLRAQMRPSGLKVVDVLTGPIEDEWRQSIRPPKVAPAVARRRAGDGFARRARGGRRGRHRQGDPRQMGRESQPSAAGDVVMNAADLAHASSPPTSPPAGCASSISRIRSIPTSPSSCCRRNSARRSRSGSRRSAATTIAAPPGTGTISRWASTPARISTRPRIG